jgi:peptidoglycan/LPS O-acetylase OafA/YrhL
MREKTRNQGLDIVRSIAILLVIICHISLVVPPPYGFNIPFKFLSMGWIGVEIFFVLSGFLIGKILIREFITEFNNEKTRPLLKFYLRRWFRTLPLYYLVLLINIIIFCFLYDDLKKSFFTHLISYFLFLQNFFGFASHDPYYFMLLSWSLVIEEWFYFLFPLFIILLKKIFKPLTHNIFFKFLIAFIFCINILRILSVLIFNLSFDKVMISVFLRLDTFAIGILLAYSSLFLPKFYKTLAKKRFFIFSLFILISSYFSTVYFQENIFTRLIIFSILPVFIALFIAFLESLGIKKARYAEFTSKISYSLYLTHVPLFNYVLAPIAYILLGANIKIPIFVMYLLFLSVVFLIAWLFYKHYEKPMMDLRESVTTQDCNKS